MPSTLIIFQTTCHRNKEERTEILRSRQVLTVQYPRIENYELQDSDESEANENDKCGLNEEVFAC